MNMLDLFCVYSKSPIWRIFLVYKNDNQKFNQMNFASTSFASVVNHQEVEKSNERNTA